MNGEGRGDGGDQVAELAEIVVTEPLDLGGVRELGVIIDTVVALNPSRLVIDVSACPHVDAAGIGLLLDTHRRMWRIGGRLTLRSPSPRIRRLLQVARVDQVFHIVDEPSPTGTLPTGAAPTAPTGAGSVDPGGRSGDVPGPVSAAPAARGRARAVVPVRAR